MFTGIVHGIGAIVKCAATPCGRRLVVDAGSSMIPPRTGDSISIDGVCLTVVEIQRGEIAFDVMAQTLSMTTIGSLCVGDAVNVESALRMGDPMGGHIVQGHVDSIGEVLAIDRSDGQCRVRLHVNDDALSIVVSQGSITVDGVSLTVASRGADWLEVALIPETLSRTALGRLAVGDRVNLEVDAIARLVDQAVARRMGVV